MSFDIIAIDFFEKQAKRLVKKYPSLQNELKQLQRQLSDTPQTGVPIGNNCYKIRLRIASKNKGKSGGARIITNVFISGQTVFLLSIYDKAEQQNISPLELKEILKLLPED